MQEIPCKQEEHVEEGCNQQAWMCAAVVDREEVEGMQKAFWLVPLKQEGRELRCRRGSSTLH